jgi:hypothetical protein
MELRKFIATTIREYLNEQVKQYPSIPDILYHGQPPKYVNGKRIEPIKFDKFDQRQKRFLSDENIGFYFTPSKREAQEYAEGGNVYVCKVNIKNPYYYENDFAYNNNGLIKTATFITNEEKSILEENGYDGVVLLKYWDRIGEVIALHPNQIQILEII